MSKLDHEGHYSVSHPGPRWPCRSFPACAPGTCSLVTSHNYKPGYSQTSVLDRLPSQTIRFSTKLFMEKMSRLLNKTLVLDLTTLSC